MYTGIKTLKKALKTEVVADCFRTTFIQRYESGTPHAFISRFETHNIF